jgi:hypothetical protein
MKGSCGFKYARRVYDWILIQTTTEQSMTEGLEGESSLDPISLLDVVLVLIAHSFRDVLTSIRRVGEEISLMTSREEKRHAYSTVIGNGTCQTYSAREVTSYVQICSHFVKVIIAVCVPSP